MDSVTQIALGATIGAVLGGKKYGKKSVLMGAIAGTIPDLDVLFSTADNPVQSMTTHRGASHSLLFTFFATPLLAFLMAKIKFLSVSFKDVQLHLIIFLGLLTHILLDAMTIYGTQIFWPLKIPPVGVGSIFIIDLLYSLPLIIGVIWFLIRPSQRVVHIGLILSTLYLTWSFVAQEYITRQVKQNYADTYSQVLVQPTPFNTLLWRALIINDNTYKVGYRSVFDTAEEITYTNFPRNIDLIAPIAEEYAPARLIWFTKGFYAAQQIDEKIILSDLRMGLEPNDYVFQFIVGEKKGDRITALPNEQYKVSRNLDRLPKIWARIWDDSVRF